MAKIPVTFTHNGMERAAFADPGQNLLDFLRRGLGDLSPKFGCGQGTCGACTVSIDGQTHLACLVLAETVQGAKRADSGRPCRWRHARSVAGRFHGTFRRAMWVLHAWNAGIGSLTLGQ